MVTRRQITPVRNLVSRIHVDTYLHFLTLADVNYLLDVLTHKKQKLEAVSVIYKMSYMYMYSVVVVKV